MTHPFRWTHILGTSTLAMATLLSATAPAYAGRFRAAHENADGGETRVFGAAHAGDAASAVRGRRVVTDGEGNVSATRGAAVEGAAGGRFKRAAHNTRSADGSATHQSGMEASTAKGSVESQGSATRDANGNVTQQRSTSATSASTGNSVESTSSYNKDTGRTRTTTCFDASGATITCPSGK